MLWYSQDMNDSDIVESARITPASAVKSSARSQSSGKASGQALRALARSDVIDSSYEDTAADFSPRRPFPQTPPSPERRINQDANRLGRIRQLKKQLERR